MNSPASSSGVIGQQHGLPSGIRLLFHYPVLNRGGAEKSMLRLMAGLVRAGCDVHLVLTRAGGSLEREIDRRITVHYLRDAWTAFPLLERRRYRALAFPVRVGAWLFGRLQEAWRRRRFRGLVFDAAATGLGGLSPAFICDHVNARRRFAFIRNDPVADRSGRWAANILQYGDCMDGYICVSHYVRRAMGEVFPKIASKLVTIYNLFDPDAMREKASTSSNPFLVESQVLRVLSVCRLQEASKALLRMVEVHRRLLGAGLHHEWHVLGDGSDRALLETAIRNAGVADTFVLHGAVANPFPYYKYADICAVLSRYEGLCGVVNEARVLERPVIATRFAGIHEQIESGVNGLIVEQDVDAICAGMTSLLEDAELRERLAKGGYPKELLDDDAKVDALLRLIGAPSAAACVDQ